MNDFKIENHSCIFAILQWNMCYILNVFKITMRDMSVDYVDRISHMLFKMAVEMGVGNYLKAADVTDLSEPDYNKLRYYVADLVRKTKGTVALEETVADKDIESLFECQE